MTPALQLRGATGCSERETLKRNSERSQESPGQAEEGGHLETLQVPQWPSLPFRDFALLSIVSGWSLTTPWQSRFRYPKSNL
jgi:hypothetical protein